jgi:hypothetical protein
MENILAEISRVINSSFYLQQGTILTESQKVFPPPVFTNAHPSLIPLCPDSVGVQGTSILCVQKKDKWPPACCSSSRIFIYNLVSGLDPSFVAL